jgi:phage gp29-like protein
VAFTSLNIGSLSPVATPDVVKAPGAQSRVDVAELGATGTPIFGGFLRELGEYNPELTGLSAIAHYERMRRSDGQVIATLNACKLPIRGAEWAIQEPKQASPVEKKATELVKSCLLEELDLDGIIENASLMLDFGCAAHEDVYYIDGNNVRLKKCAARLPLTFYRWITEANGDDLIALEQMGYRGGQYLTTQVPVEKLSLFTFRQEGANFTGQSLLRPAYQHWYIKSNLYKVEAIACERNGMGVPNIEMAAGASVEDRKAATDWLQALSANEKTSILLPPLWKFSLTGVTGTVHSPKDAIDHHNSMISQAALASFINFGQGKASGNRALGQTMSDFFYIGLQATANQIARVISETTIKRLVDYNFAGVIHYPRLIPQQIISMKFEDVVSALKDLASAGVNIVQPDDELEDWCRTKFGAPPRGKARPRPAGGGSGAAPSGDVGTLSEVFKPKRAPRGAEKFMALSEMASALDKGRDDVAAALREARPRVQAYIIQRLMNTPVRNAHRVSVAPDEKLVAKIEGILEGVSSYGLHTVEAERSKQLAGAKPSSAAAIRAAEKRDPLGVYADGVVSEYTNNLQQRAANVVLDLKRRPADKTAGQMIIDAGETLDDQSDGWIDNAAAKGASEAFAAGRNDGYEQYADEISSVQYSALLDTNTCDTCSGADGQEGDTPDDVPDVPNPDCDGGDKCRCVLVYIFGDEAKAAA